MTSKFNLDQSIKCDAQAEAMVHVIRKLREDKLKFCPGKAPAFNLLTTTIYRLICSYLSKISRQNERDKQLVQDAYRGAVPAKLIGQQ